MKASIAKKGKADDGSKKTKDVAGVKAAVEAAVPGAKRKNTVPPPMKAKAAKVDGVKPVAKVKAKAKGQPKAKGKGKGKTATSKKETGAVIAPTAVKVAVGAGGGDAGDGADAGKGADATGAEKPATNLD